MINFNIINIISRLNNRKTKNIEVEVGKVNKGLLYILDNLELKGFINFTYNPYTNKIFIFNNKINYITIKSKPSRSIFVNKNPYVLSLGVFISKPSSYNNNFELLLYVE